MTRRWYSWGVLIPIYLACALPVLHAERAVIVAGGGTADTGVATGCQLRTPFAVDFDRKGIMYVAEMAGGERVLKIDRRGQLSVIAGTGATGKGGDGGFAAQAQFNGIHSLALGPGGNLYLADTWNNRVRRLHLASGRVFAFAGTGRKGFGGDGGPAVAAEF